MLSGKYPDDVVIAGNPAKVICNIDAFAEKRRRQMLDNAVLYAQQWKNRRGRYPTIREMTNAFSWLYLPHEQDTIVKYPELFCLGGIDEVMFKKDFLSAEPQFPSYESFLDYVNSQGITP